MHFLIAAPLMDDGFTYSELVKLNESLDGLLTMISRDFNNDEVIDFARGHINIKKDVSTLFIETDDELDQYLNKSFILSEEPVMMGLKAIMSEVSRIILSMSIAFENSIETADKMYYVQILLSKIMEELRTFNDDNKRIYVEILSFLILWYEE